MWYDYSDLSAFVTFVFVLILLTFTSPCAYSADEKLVIFFLFFAENML